MREHIKDIRFYHGSLEELNSRPELKKKFHFVTDSFFISRGYREPCRHNLDEASRGYFSDNFTEGLAVLDMLEEVRRKGYDGLVNTKTILYQNDGNFLMAVEGTPIEEDR